MKQINFNTLSKWGLIYKINKEVLHPLGLALSRNPSTGYSEGCYIDDSGDFEWEYAKSTEKVNKDKLEEFEKNRIKILKEIE